MNNNFEFISVIEACGLLDLEYSGQHFTWCNQRDEKARVWKRLDRALVNDKWLARMPQTTITHLPSVGSDHNPLLMEMIIREENKKIYFKFLHYWIDNKNFMNMLENVGIEDYLGSHVGASSENEEVICYSHQLVQERIWGHLF
ncbi:uncharacterized protein LOC129894765 [Solanum dulcamara]|uniref:uncharacterized protein LOC129894765 n=1 Tax=Solanum dulcamara TaxID=45834 RepID=UPI002485F3D2|nr:uncharacterized protein LOC129894765 [Solanum dulcamara]